MDSYMYQSDTVVSFDHEVAGGILQVKLNSQQ